MLGRGITHVHMEQKSVSRLFTSLWNDSEERVSVLKHHMIYDISVNQQYSNVKAKEIIRFTFCNKHNLHLLDNKTGKGHQLKGQL